MIAQLIILGLLGLLVYLHRRDRRGLLVLALLVGLIRMAMQLGMWPAG